MADNLVGDLLGQERDSGGIINKLKKSGRKLAKQEAMTISSAGLDVRSSTSVDGKDGA
jgi:hypothetical protein